MSNLKSKSSVQFLLAMFALIVSAACGGWMLGRSSLVEFPQQQPLPGVASAQSLKVPSAQSSGTPPPESTADQEGTLPSANSPQFALRIRDIFNDPLDTRRLARFQLLLEKCDTAQFAAMVPLIRENDLRGTGSGKEWELVMSTWGRRDGAATLDFIRNFDWTGWDQRAAPGARYQAFIGFAASDPQSALAYLRNPQNGMDDPNLQHAMMVGWTAKNPEEAANWLLSPDAGTERPIGHQLVVDAICRKGGQQLLDHWFSTLPPDATGIEQMARAVATAKSRFQPDKAAEWIESQKGKPWAEDGPLVSNTAFKLAESDPQSAISWADRIGSTTALQTVMSTWCKKDLMSASSWLKEHPNTPHYDSAVLTLISAVAQEDPSAARAWAGTIKDPAQREAVLNRLQPER